MAIAVNDVIRVTYFQRLFDQRILTVLHMRCITAPAPGTADIVALTNLADRLGQMASAPLQKWIPLVPSALLFDEVRAQRVSPTRSIYGKNFIGTTGSRVGTTVATANVAASIEKRSAIPGRTGIGRVQMAGVVNEVMVNASLTPDFLVEVQDCWEELLGNITVALDGAVYDWIIWGAGIPTLDNGIVDVQAKDTVRTMHRRTKGIGI